jgi:hypothetical protein
MVVVIWLDGIQSLDPGRMFYNTLIVLAPKHNDPVYRSYLTRHGLHLQERHLKVNF